MFTGLIEEIGMIRAVTRQQQGALVEIGCSAILADLAIGDSVAVDGVCLTVVAKATDSFSAQAVSETLQRSTLGIKQTADAVNLERALLPGSRLGGHFVQGHVDVVGRVEQVQAQQPGFYLILALPPENLLGCVEKGSIAVDGVSLTIAQVNNNSISLAVIPHTARHTTLSRKRSGDPVNIETDILGKYVRRLFPQDRTLSLEKLAEWGF